MTFFRTVVALLLFLPGVAHPADLGMARISLIKGDVQIHTEDTGEWVPAAANMPLREGDRVWAPAGARAEIQIQEGVFIRLDAGTSFDILALEGESFQFYLDRGHAYINNRQGGIDHIQVDTPLSSVGCYDNSLVMIDVAERGATDVSVVKGYSYAETRSGKTRVPAGSTLHIGEDMEAEFSPIAPPDNWERWNLKRDQKLAEARESLRYLPDELDTYAYDLDENGRWVYVSEYGYCWTPRVGISVDWAPYQTGRWVWIGGSYVWISHETWGWAPYHYGRWAFVSRFGWCWVPPHRGEAFWSPGYVGWVYTPTYVAWVPLAPGERYYGYGYYGPLSVNITNITVNRTAIREFRNVNVNNAVTVLRRDSFLSGRKERVRVRGNLFNRDDVRIGPPAFKPGRETVMPAMKRIPPAKLPPETVRRTSIREIRRERRVVPEEGGSVFRPQRPPESMPVTRSNEPKRLSRPQPPASPAPQPKARGREGVRREEGRRPQIVTPVRPAPSGVPRAVPQSHPPVAPPGRPGVGKGEPGGVRRNVPRTYGPAAPALPSGGQREKPSVVEEPREKGEGKPGRR